MSINVLVHFDATRMVSLARWKEVIAQCGYPIEFLSSFNPLEGPGSIDCSYGPVQTVFEYFLDEEPETPAPPGASIANRAVAEFVARTVHGEAAWHAAVASASSLCIATDGVIEQDGDTWARGDDVAAWARSILHEDQELEQLAAAFPHPDSVDVAQIERDESISFQALMHLVFKGEVLAKRLLFDNYRFEPFGLAMLDPDRVEELAASIDYRALQESARRLADAKKILACVLVSTATIPGELSAGYRDGIRIHVEAAGISQDVYIPYRVLSHPWLRKFFVLFVPVRYSDPITMDTEAMIFPALRGEE